MPCFRKSLFGLLVGAVAVCAAEYSEPTRKAFMEDCTREANEKECLCVLDKMQNQYSEKAFLNYYTDMKKGSGNADFISFMTGAAMGCVAAPKEVSEEELKQFFNAMKQQTFKNEFVQACSPEAKEVVGDKAAREFCSCAYARMVADWGLDYLSECIPEKFTPEAEQYLIRYMNQEGIPLSASQCLLNALKKEYTLRAFLVASVKNSEVLQTILIGLASKCMGAAY